MTKFIYSLIFLFPFVLISCGGDDDNNIDGNNPPDNKNRLSVTYKATSQPEGKTFIMVSYNDNQGNFIVKNVESGWSLDVELPEGKKAFISGVVQIKDEYLEEAVINSATTKVQILQNGKVSKEAEGLSVVAEIEP